MAETKQHSNGRATAEIPASNMRIWNEVCDTDPKYTKHVDMRGGFDSIDPVYQLRRATALWGPYGSVWGIRKCVWGIIEDSPKKTMTLDAEFWYPGGQFDIAVDMPFKVNDDCRKKLLTQARSKALSLLGFSADVFIGKFEDEKYVAEMRTKFADEDQLRETILKAIRTAPNEERLAQCREKLDKLRGDNAINKALYDEGLEAIEQQTQELGV